MLGGIFPFAGGDMCALTGDLRQMAASVSSGAGNLTTVAATALDSGADALAGTLQALRAEMASLESVQRHDVSVQSAVDSADQVRTARRDHAVAVARSQEVALAQLVADACAVAAKHAHAERRQGLHEALFRARASESRSRQQEFALSRRTSPRRSRGGRPSEQHHDALRPSGFAGTGNATRASVRDRAPSVSPTGRRAADSPRATGYHRHTAVRGLHPHASKRDAEIEEFLLEVLGPAALLVDDLPVPPSPSSGYRQPQRQQKAGAVAGDEPSATSPAMARGAAVRAELLLGSSGDAYSPSPTRSGLGDGSGSGNIHNNSHARSPAKKAIPLPTPSDEASFGVASGTGDDDIAEIAAFLSQQGFLSSRGEKQPLRPATGGRVWGQPGRRAPVEL